MKPPLIPDEPVARDALNDLVVRLRLKQSC